MKEINLFCAKGCREIPYLGSHHRLAVLQSIMAQHIASYGSHAKNDFAWEWGRDLPQNEQVKKDIETALFFLNE